MKWQNLGDEHCSLARTLSVIGDRWTLLVLREAFLRVRRFEDFQERLGIARRVLTERLKHLVDHGVLKKIVYQDAPPRFEYRLTQKGVDLYPVMVGLVHWGDAHYAGKKGPPLLHRHVTCGHDFRGVLTCSQCGEPVDPRQVQPHVGPGAGKGLRLTIRESSKGRAR
jgi:DNA-binding HxlR family transcriptional regulator